MHPEIHDIEQHMLLVMVEGSRDRTHMHPSKREALIPVVGSARYEIFNHAGTKVDSHVLGEQGLRYVSSPVGVYHRLVLTDEVFAFWEVALGPFTEDSTVPAPWETAKQI